jgi:hypothetical protein
MLRIDCEWPLFACVGMNMSATAGGWCSDGTPKALSSLCCTSQSHNPQSQSQWQNGPMPMRNAQCANAAGRGPLLRAEGGRCGRCLYVCHCCLLLVAFFSFGAPWPLLGPALDVGHWNWVVLLLLACSFVLQFKPPHVLQSLPPPHGALKKIKKKRRTYLPAFF